MIDRLAELVALDATMTVADIGTGIGFVAAGLVGYGARVVGVDASAAMLEVARAQPGPAGHLRRGAHAR